MAQPTQLDATEQDTLVKQIGLALLRAAPHDWQHVNVEYRALGRYHELSGDVTLSDGTVTEWVATHDIATLFGKLRAGMYREGRGTWFNARYQLDHPSSYNLEYDREEPAWDLMPPAQAYSDELHMFPRSEDDVPDWLVRRMSGLGTANSDRRFRTARIFDGTDASGNPVIDRDDLAPEEQDRVLEYLDSAPVVIPGRGYDVDLLAGTYENRVPVAFHSDGVWIWPAAANYYLREYGVSPEAELVEHIRANRYAVPEVPDGQRQAAAEHVNRGAQPPHGPPGGPPREQAPPQPEQPPQPQPAGPGTTYMPNPGLEPGPLTTVTAPVNGQPPGRPDAAGQSPQPDAPADDVETVIERLRASLHDLRVDDARYTIGEPARHSWCLEELDDGWRVGWYDESLTNPAVFGDVADAAAFMLGKLLLTEDAESPGAGTAGDAQPRSGPAAGPALGAGPEQREPDSDRVSLPTEFAPAATPEPHESPELPATPPPPPARPPEAGPPGGAAPPRAPQPPTGQAPPPPQRDAPQQGGAAQQSADAQQSAGSSQQGGSGNQWPIQPLTGEPPLTLFRGKELRELPAGSELDRFGGPDGNLTYAAGTPFEERSLVPDWVNRPYHVYRVQRPLETLAGMAIPWFNQPGGGAAYMLPDSIEQHLAEGDLIELEAGEPPVD